VKSTLKSRLNLFNYHEQVKISNYIFNQQLLPLGIATLPYKIINRSFARRLPLLNFVLLVNVKQMNLTCPAAKNTLDYINN
jgi:hypothetical protein